MNTVKTHYSQKGFFDLGMGLALLAIFGATAYILAPDSESKESEQSEIPEQQKQITKKMVDRAH